MTNLNKILTIYFTNEGIKNYLPHKDSGEKDKKGKSIFYGAMADFNADNFKSSSENSYVKREGKWETADLFELNISSINKNICVLDIDGDSDKVIDFKGLTDNEKMNGLIQISLHYLKVFHIPYQEQNDLRIIILS